MWPARSGRLGLLAWAFLLLLWPCSTGFALVELSDEAYAQIEQALMTSDAALARAETKLATQDVLLEKQEQRLDRLEKKIEGLNQTFEKLGTASDLLSTSFAAQEQELWAWRVGTATGVLLTLLAILYR